LSNIAHASFREAVCAKLFTGGTENLEAPREIAAAKTAVTFQVGVRTLQ
jgi:hypothetical protein